jgi:hypothetical protein
VSGQDLDLSITVVVSLITVHAIFWWLFNK